VTSVVFFSTLRFLESDSSFPVLLPFRRVDTAGRISCFQYRRKLGKLNTFAPPTREWRPPAKTP